MLKLYFTVFPVFSSLLFSKTSSFPCLISALANLEATQLVQSVVEGLEARLATLRNGMVDMPTTQEAVERAQVSFPPDEFKYRYSAN